jgi:hypothetical protein
MKNFVGAQCLRPQIKINVSPKRAGASIAPLQSDEKRKKEKKNCTKYRKNKIIV